MVVLSVLLSAVANVTVHSINSVLRADAGVTSATIAQDTMERLLSVPVSSWAFDANGNVKKAKTTSMGWGDGRRYTIDRKIEPVDNPYTEIQSCDVVVGSGTNASDLIKVTIGVTPENNKGRDRYETIFFLSRDDESAVTESSLTVRFNVARGNARQPYTESMNGPIEVAIGKGSGQKRATTKQGCVTFVGLRERMVDLSFTTRSYKESLSGLSTYSEHTYLVKGGHRLVEFDLVPEREVSVVPKLMGHYGNLCAEPRLLRTRTVLGAMGNRARFTLAEVAVHAHDVFRRLNAIPPSQRTAEDRMRIQAGSHWQYYIECQSAYKPDGSPRDTLVHLLPDTIPISLVTKQGNKRTLRQLTTWADSNFRPSDYPYVEEADWPVVSLPEPASGETQYLMVGSCIMSGTEAAGVMVPTDGQVQGHWRPGLPPVVRLPMWSAPIDGIEEPPYSLNDYDGTFPVVIRQIHDDGTDSRFGDPSIRAKNKAQYSGCEDTPVFHVGWLYQHQYPHNHQQLRLLLPFGLYTYAYATPDKTEKNKQGQTVIRSRDTCTTSCQHAKGESACIRAGAKQYRLYDWDGRSYIHDHSGNDVTYFGYVDWTNRQHSFYDPTRTASTIPRGPVLEGCPALQFK